MIHTFKYLEFCCKIGVRSTSGYCCLKSYRACKPYNCTHNLLPAMTIATLMCVHLIWLLPCSQVVKHNWLLSTCCLLSTCSLLVAADRCICWNTRCQRRSYTWGASKAKIYSMILENGRNKVKICTNMTNDSLSFHNGNCKTICFGNEIGSSCSRHRILPTKGI